MLLSEPKAKKANLQVCPEPFVNYNFSSNFERVQGIFNDFSVIIENEDHMRKISSMGCFGKGTFSRNYLQKSTNLIRNRVFENRKKCFDKTKNSTQRVIVLPDSDSEADIQEYFTNLTPKYEFDSSGIKETINLGLDEAFFLVSALNCLDVKYEEKILNLEELWNLFKKTDPHFVVNYVIYYYLRSKNWVVKPGLKFGGDFLMYKQGPAYFHASYVVIIHVIDENYTSIDCLNKHSMSYVNLAGLNRLCETTGKELLICDLIWPAVLAINDVGIEDLSKFTVKETVMKRWVPTQNK